MADNQIRGLSTRTLALNDLIPTQSQAGTSDAGKNTIQNVSDLILPKTYKAYLTQSGSAAPIATIIANTLGGTLVFTRSTNGEYLATLAGTFPASKTFISNGLRFQSFTGTNFVQIYILRSSDNAISISTGVGANGSPTPTDGVLASTDFEITVYP